jgi:hypothetical protein
MMAQKILALSDRQELAKRKNGQCLSEKYITRERIRRGFNYEKPRL